MNMMMDDSNKIINDIDFKPDIFLNRNTVIKTENMETVVFIPVDHEFVNNIGLTGKQLVGEIKDICIKEEMEEFSNKEEMYSKKRDDFYITNKPNGMLDDNSNQYDNDLETKVTDQKLLFNHLIKEEIVTDTETTQNVSLNKHKENLHKNLNNSFKNNAMVIIKNELIDPEIHEEHVHYVNKTSDHTQDLYRDHVIKEEIAIGPEVVQKVEPINHETSHKLSHRSKKYCCQFCNKSYESKHSLTRHNLKAHSEGSPDKAHNCDPYDKKHNSKSSPHQYNSGSLDNSKYKCKVCGKCFSYRGNLSRHMKIHTGKKPHTCDQCNLTFGRKDYLSFHIRKHHSGKLPGEKDLRCELCNKGLASKNNLNYHLKFTCPTVKEKAKPIRDKTYTCDICLLSYSYRTSLKAHIIRRHTKTVLPTHECDICGQKYMKKHNLQCHMMSKHMNKKPYHCSKCRESFTWHSSLSSHERKVHSRAPPKRHIKTECLDSE